MGRSSGTRNHKCPYCGKPYVRTNWMVRYGHVAKDGKLLSDTHLIACYRKHTTPETASMEKDE